MKTISAEELKEHQKEKEQILLDVRTPAEYSSAHLKGAINIPLGSTNLENFIKEQSSNKNPIYVLCQSGKRAETVCSSFSDINSNLILVKGGMNECKEAKMDRIEGKGAISLERQVRIAAGSIVLVGFLASKLYATEWIYLSAFVGAGLIFAGVTDSCAMGLILAKMPWNNRNNSSCSR